MMSYYYNLQETSSWIHEVLFNQLLMGIFSVVLHWERRMWILTVPYFWVESLEAHVFTSISS
jgi:hypothetical protein